VLGGSPFALDYQLKTTILKTEFKLKINLYSLFGLPTTVAWLLDSGRFWY